jgi:hypothetical protein
MYYTNASLYREDFDFVTTTDKISSVSKVINASLWTSGGRRKTFMPLWGELCSKNMSCDGWGHFTPCSSFPWIRHWTFGLMNSSHFVCQREWRWGRAETSPYRYHSKMCFSCRCWPQKGKSSVFPLGPLEKTAKLLNGLSGTYLWVFENEMQLMGGEYSLIKRS